MLFLVEAESDECKSRIRLRLLKDDLDRPRAHDLGTSVTLSQVPFGTHQKIVLSVETLEAARKKRCRQESSLNGATRAWEEGVVLAGPTVWFKAPLWSAKPASPSTSLLLHTVEPTKLLDKID